MTGEGHPFRAFGNAVAVAFLACATALAITVILGVLFIGAPQ